MNIHAYLSDSSIPRPCFYATQAKNHHHDHTSYEQTENKESSTAGKWKGKKTYSDYLLILRKYFSQFKWQNDSSESKWIWIAKHLNHRYTSYMQIYAVLQTTLFSLSYRADSDVQEECEVGQWISFCFFLS